MKSIGHTGIEWTVDEEVEAQIVVQQGGELEKGGGKKLNSVDCNRQRRI